MPRLILRVSKRKTSWETRDVDNIVNTEFKDRDGGVDLVPSVYVLDSAHDDDALRQDVVRVHAEHAASFLQNPPKGARSIDLDGLVEPSPTPGETDFQFANSRHHEVHLSSVDDLRALVQQTLSTLDTRVRPVERDAMLGYAASKLAEQDAEWRAATQPGKPGHEWLALIRKRAQRTS
jgi:hypothetical protein